MAKILMISIFCLSGCATSDKKYIPDISLVEGEKLVSVNSALELAFHAYMAGCIRKSLEKNKSERYQPAHPSCTKAARSYMKDIEDIVGVEPGKQPAKK